MDLLALVEAVVAAVVGAVVTVEEGETDPLVELVVVEVGGEEETDQLEELEVLEVYVYSECSVHGRARTLYSLETVQ